MDARPEWVPEWVWGDFQSYRDFILVCEPRDADDPERDICLVESILRDEECTAVWHAIDKRKGEPTRRHRRWCEERGLPSNLRGPGEAERLFDSLTYFASGVPRGSAIPSSERRAMAARIKAHALALRGELDALEARCNGEDYPEAIANCFIGLADQVANDCTGQLAEFFLHRFKELPGEVREAFAIGVMSGLQNVERTLGALADAADMWGRTKPTIVRPNDANAPRLHFMREMTGYFRKHYGTPLREPVAALTRNIYQCDMDAATVSKLAP